MKLSVLIPVFNEISTIAAIVGLVRAVPLDIELVVVDDGSTDGTREFLSGLAGIDRLVLHDRNRGKGAAIRTGLALANGEVVVIQDADLEYNPLDFVPMLEEMRRLDAPVIFGSRILGHNSWSHVSFYLGGRFLSLLANVLYRIRITDEATCYKMLRRDVLMGLDLRCERFEFCPEVTARLALAGIPIREIPIRYQPRTRREGKKIGWKDGWQAIQTLVKLRFGRDSGPLHSGGKTV